MNLQKNRPMDKKIWPNRIEHHHDLIKICYQTYLFSALSESLCKAFPSALLSNLCVIACGLNCSQLEEYNPIFRAVGEQL